MTEINKGKKIEFDLIMMNMLDELVYQKNK